MGCHPGGVFAFVVLDEHEGDVVGLDGHVLVGGRDDNAESSVAGSLVFGVVAFHSERIQESMFMSTIKQVR